jgi:hypothetical protein
LSTFTSYIEITEEFKMTKRKKGFFKLGGAVFGFGLVGAGAVFASPAADKVENHTVIGESLLGATGALACAYITNTAIAGVKDTLEANLVKAKRRAVELKGYANTIGYAKTIELYADHVKYVKKVQTAAEKARKKSEEEQRLLQALTDTLAGFHA